VTKQDCIGTSYQPLGGGYAYSALRCGLTIRNPQGRDIFIQMGDDENAMRENLKALDEISLDVDDEKRAVIADMMLGEYFA
jgi:hypothetical protein